MFWNGIYRFLKNFVKISVLFWLKKKKKRQYGGGMMGSNGEKCERREESGRGKSGEHRVSSGLQDTWYFIWHLWNLHRVSASEWYRPPPLMCSLLKLLGSHLVFHLCLWPGVIFLRPETMSCPYWHAQDLAWGDASWAFGEWVSAWKDPLI